MLTTENNRKWYVVNGIDVRKFSTHTDINELNVTVNYAVSMYCAEMTKSTVNVLRHIAQFAIKSVGVAWKRIEGIAESLAINEKTVRRALSTLERIGVINRIKTRRASGYRGVDIIVINRLEEAHAEMSGWASGEEASNDADSTRKLRKYILKMSGHKAIKAIKSFKAKTDKDKRDDDKTQAQAPALSSESLEDIFAKEAESLGLPEDRRSSVLDRIKQRAASIGSLIAYIRKSIRTALANLANIDSKRQNVSNARQKPSDNTSVNPTPNNATTTPVDAFKTAVQAAIYRTKTDKRKQAVPTELLAAAERDKARFVELEAQKQAERDAISIEEKRARIQAMLSATVETWTPQN